MNNDAEFNWIQPLRLIDFKKVQLDIEFMHVESKFLKHPSKFKEIKLLDCNIPIDCNERFVSFKQFFKFIYFIVEYLEHNDISKLSFITRGDSKEISNADHA